MQSTLVTRAHICERLRLSYWQCWKLFPSDVGAKIWDGRVVNLLRNKAVNVRNVPDYIPSDLLTPEELAKEIGVKRSWLLAQVKNVRRALPHYRLGSRTVLIQRSAFSEWCEKSNKRRRSA